MASHVSHGAAHADERVASEAPCVHEGKLMCVEWSSLRDPQPEAIGLSMSTTRLPSDEDLACLERRAHRAVRSLVRQVQGVRGVVERIADQPMTVVLALQMSADSAGQVVAQWVTPDGVTMQAMARAPDEPVHWRRFQSDMQRWTPWHHDSASVANLLSPAELVELDESDPGADPVIAFR